MKASNSLELYVAEMGKLTPRKSESALLGMVEGQVRQHQREALARGPEKFRIEQIKLEGRRVSAVGSRLDKSLGVPKRD